MNLYTKYNLFIRLLIKQKNTKHIAWYLLVRVTGLEPARSPTRSLAVRVCQFRHTRKILLWYYTTHLNIFQPIFSQSLHIFSIFLSL